MPPPGPSGGSTGPSSYETPIVGGQTTDTGGATARGKEVYTLGRDAPTVVPPIDRPSGNRWNAAYLGRSTKALQVHRGKEQMGGVGTTGVFVNGSC